MEQLQQSLNVIGWCLFGTFLLMGYFLPMIIAARRLHPNFGPIAVLNIAFGWTGIGWIGTLAWSFSGSR